MEIIYVDSMFLINTVINYFLLMASSRICGVALSRFRLGLAAAVGGLYAVAVFLPGCAFLASATCKLAAAVLMLVVAFGKERRLLRIGLVFFAVSAAFGGAVYAATMMSGFPDPRRGGVYLPVSMKTLALSFAVCYGALTVVFRNKAENAKRSLRRLELCLGGNTVSINALHDTGNGLYEPVSGKHVIVAEASVLLPLFDERTAAVITGVRNPAQAFETLGRQQKSGMRFLLVPYSAVGVEMNLLLAFKPDSVRIDGTETSGIIVAFSPTKLCADGEFSAIA